MIFEYIKENIYIRKSIKTVLWFEFYFIMFYGIVRDFLKLPNLVSYGIDVLNIILFVYVLLSNKLTKIEGRYYKVIISLITILFLSTIIGCVNSQGNILSYVLGFRNVFRFYIYVICACLIFDLEELSKFKTVIKRLYIINFIICILQYILGYKQDNMGGIFGMQSGANGPLNLFLIIVTSIYMLEFLSKKINSTKLILFLLSALVIFAMAELKIYLFELIIIILFALILSKFSFRKIAITILGICSIPIGIYIMGQIFPGFGFEFFFGDGLYNYLFGANYSNENDLGRLTAVPTLYEMFFKGNIILELFGIGLGNGASTSLSFINTDFFDRFGYLNYIYFSDSYIYLELGLIGLVLFEMVFISLLFFSLNLFKKMSLLRCNANNDFYLLVQVSVIVSFMSICMTIYNSSMTIEAGYIFYMFLIPPIIIDINLENGLGLNFEGIYYECL